MLSDGKHEVHSDRPLTRWLLHRSRDTVGLGTRTTRTTARSARRRSTLQFHAQNAPHRTMHLDVPAPCPATARDRTLPQVWCKYHLHHMLVRSSPVHFRNVSVPVREAKSSHSSSVNNIKHQQGKVRLYGEHKQSEIQASSGYSHSTL